MALHRDLRRQRARTRSLLQALSRSALQDAGERVSAAEAAEQGALEAIAVQLPAALAAGLTVTEIAELTGLSRQKIYDLRKRDQARAGDLLVRLLVRLAAEGAQSLESLQHGVGEADGPTVRRGVEELMQRGAVHLAVTQYEGDDSDEWFLITPAGEVELEALLESTVAERHMTVYARVEPDELPALVALAPDVLGQRYAVLEPGTLNDQTWTELAFDVVAPDGAAAVKRGRERLDALRRAAGVKRRPAVITAVAPRTS